MASLALEQNETLVPTADDRRIAEDSSRRMSTIKPKGAKSLSVRVQSEGQDEYVPIPASLFRMLMDILTNMAKGNAVTMVPSHAELTTQQAADILNVSRPFVIQLIQNQQLPHKMVGTHRRILFADLLDYKKRIDADRLATLGEIARQAQELNMGY